MNVNGYKDSHSSLNTEFLGTITDDFGIWQFSKNGKPIRSEGYSLDDNARALIAFLRFGCEEKARVCLNYIESSIYHGTFYGFANENRQFITYPGSLDAHGLAYWALSHCVSVRFFETECMQVLRAIDNSFAYKNVYIRPLMYILLGQSLLKEKVAHITIKNILSRYKPEIQWFEEKLTYANPAIPYSLLSYLNSFKIVDSDIEKVVLGCIKTIENYMMIGVIPAPIGNRFWQEINSNIRDIYGQQPIDAGFAVLMYLEAYDYFKEEKYLEMAKVWFSWFLGNNIWKTSLISRNGACFDGLTESGLKKHNGAESSIMLLLAYKRIIKYKDFL